MAIFLYLFLNFLFTKYYITHDPVWEHLMDFHFILKEVEAGAVIWCIFLWQKTVRWMLLSQLSGPTLNLLKGVLSLRPFRAILPNKTILSLLAKILHYEPLRISKHWFNYTFIF